ncbi:hypothetical protein OPV22_007534 [Ensete ventricosum]|uniref:Uncharacterized protein n=1 Tax=Ensete ventricosum TaxID=4639 RepID=A0AAV8RRW8_ENSVE|nr:hypothetical protein OPV22_007534 [Ensete ventricosum]
MYDRPRCDPQTYRTLGHGRGAEKYVRVWAPESGKHTDVIRSVGCDREGSGSRLMTPGWWGHVTPQSRLLRRRTAWLRARAAAAHAVRLSERERLGPAQVI